jgi:5-methylcytosine-specific restriction endonuclease McrA
VSIAPSSAALRCAVADRAYHCCKYCGITDEATLVPHEPDHIVGEQHGGETMLANLAYACFRCNRYKGPNIATRDPQTGSLAPLFNPRTERWSTHFHLDGAAIIPLTPVGPGERITPSLQR